MHTHVRAIMPLCVTWQQKRGWRREVPRRGVPHKMRACAGVCTRVQEWVSPYLRLKDPNRCHPRPASSNAQTACPPMCWRQRTCNCVRASQCCAALVRESVWVDAFVRARAQVHACRHACVRILDCVHVCMYEQQLVQYNTSYMYRAYQLTKNPPPSLPVAAFTLPRFLESSARRGGVACLMVSPAS